MCQFFYKRGYPVSVVQAGYHRVQQIDRQSALQKAEKENIDRIPFTLTFHPHNHAVKSIFLKNFKLHSKTIQWLVLSFRNLHQFHSNMTKRWSTFWLEVHFKPMTNLELSNAFAHVAKLVLSFKKCSSADVIYCITCTYFKNWYIGEIGRRLGDWFWEHLRDVERKNKDASKPVDRHLNLPNHSKLHMAVCGLSLHLGSLKTRKTLGHKIYFPSRHS